MNISLPKWTFQNSLQLKLNTEMSWMLLYINSNTAVIEEMSGVINSEIFPDVTEKQ